MNCGRNVALPKFDIDASAAYMNGLLKRHGELMGMSFLPHSRVAKRCLPNMTSGYLRNYAMEFSRVDGGLKASPGASCWLHQLIIEWIKYHQSKAPILLMIISA